MWAAPWSASEWPTIPLPHPTSHSGMFYLVSGIFHLLNNTSHLVSGIQFLVSGICTTIPVGPHPSSQFGCLAYSMWQLKCCLWLLCLPHHAS